MKLIAIDQLIPDPHNPRKHFDPVKLKELADNIKEQGVLTELWVREAPTGKGFMIIAGERRFRASKMAGLDKVPCDVKDWDDKRVAENQIVENLQRDDLNPLEEARAYKYLMDTHGYDAKGVADKIGKSPSYVYGCFRLLKLTPKWHKAIDAGEVSVAMAAVVATRLQLPDYQDHVLEGLQGNYGEYSDCETAEDLRQAIEEKHDRNLKRAPWNLQDAELLPKAGACATCPFRSKAQIELLGDAGKEDFCTKGECWDEKKKLHTAKLMAEYKAAGKDVITGEKVKALLKDADTIYSQGKYISMDLDPGSRNGSHCGKTGHQLIKAAGLEAKVVVVMGRDGQLRKLFDRQTLKELGTKADGHTKSNTAGKKKSPQQKAADAKETAKRVAARKAEELEEAARFIAGEMLAEQIQKRLLITKPMLSVIAIIAKEGMVGSDTEETVAGLLGLEKFSYARADAVFKEAVQDSVKACKLLGYSIAWHGGPMVEVKARLKALGVDWAKAEAEAKKRIVLKEDPEALATVRPDERGMAYNVFVKKHGKEEVPEGFTILEGMPENFKVKNFSVAEEVDLKKKGWVKLPSGAWTLPGSAKKKGGR